MLKKKKKMPKTMIAVPCMDMIPTDFWRSWIQLDKMDSVVSICQATLIYDARQMLADRAIESGYERVVWFDSDMILPPDAMRRLMEDADEGRDIVSGLYFTRKDPIKPVIFKQLGEREKEPGKFVSVAVPYMDYPRDQIFEAAAIGFGGCITTVKCLKHLKEKYGLPFQPMGFGEDLAFCARATASGYKVWVDSRIKMGHLRKEVVDEEVWDAIRTE